MRGVTISLTILAGWILAMVLPAAALNPETALLLKLLEKKGVITAEDAAALEREVASIRTSGENPPSDAVTSGRLLPAISERVTLSGLVEVEAAQARNFAKQTSGRVDLATVELGIEAKPTPWATGTVLLKWESPDNEQVFVDEGFVTLGPAERVPVSLTAGRIYLPFGRYRTHMISDPLTLNIGETNQGAVSLGVEAGGVFGSVYAFNGDVDEAYRTASGDDPLEACGLAAGYRLEGDGIWAEATGDWISNLMDSDGIGDYLNGNGIALQSATAGYALSAAAGWGPLTLIGEYVAALEDPVLDSGSGFAAAGAPRAWNLEAAVRFSLFAKNACLAAGWQGTENCRVMDLPERRLVGTLGIELVEHLRLAVEYAQDHDYSRGQGGTGETAHSITTQTALEF